MTTDSDDEIRIRCSTPELLAMPFVRYLFSRKEKRSSSRGLGLVTKGIWAMFEPSQAKTILYYIGRMAGREISEATEKEYNTKKAKTWPELLGNIEIFCDLLAGSRATVTDVSSNRAIIKLYDSPSCYKVSGFPKPCCDYMAGIFASLPAYDFDGVQATCRELECRGVDQRLPHCTFELRVTWPDGKPPL
ncbi:MAG TPA: hypothetical protein PKV16_05675 [Caldisericia bacterium]|nr:hypothetical protein [Caldisericia bacterium]HPF49323.1 hypothetical protein [Caldisericia bacterium]HPI83997.1 hypothetical protein [Caldisericia bacterium]HPQ93255.1 hypothetical protein [Caldisericia bacterium]HRV75363.1 hypothetical protein [Caldisericia bacterium]